MIPCALQHVNSSNCKVSWETLHGTKGHDVEDDPPKMSICCHEIHWNSMSGWVLQALGHFYGDFPLGHPAVLELGGKNRLYSGCLVITNNTSKIFPQPQMFCWCTSNPNPTRIPTPAPTQRWEPLWPCSLLYAYTHIPIKCCKISMFVYEEIKKPRFFLRYFSVRCRRRWETAPVNGAISKKEQLWSLETWDKSLALGMLLQGSYFILNVFFHCVLISFSIHHMRSWSPLTIWYNLMLFRESGSTSARTELYLPSCILQFCLRGAIQLNSHAMMVPRRFVKAGRWFVSHNLKCS